jgi:CheY-like chemotaxis protein
MIKLSKRMSTLTQQLLAYARGGKYNPCEVKLGQLIKGSIELIKHRLPPEIELEVDLAARQDLVSVDTAQLQMVLLALYHNAVEAMEKGGRICISTKEAFFAVEEMTDHSNRRPGPYVCLTVRDNGCGMSKETESKIFDPFFTTKFIGRGLGLSAAYGIIANHNGWIAASTERGKGTEIRAYLPLQAAKETGPSENALSHNAVIGDATLLVVEDEPMVLDAACTLLQKMNYRVLRAETGRDALEALRTSDASVDLVLLDVRLPDLEADVVYQEMHKIQPGIRVVLWSGYDNSGPVEDLLDAGADGFLQKPFSKDRLIEKVLSVLGQRPETTAGPDRSKLGGGSKYLRVIK